MRLIVALIITVLSAGNTFAANLRVGSPSPDIQAKLLDSGAVFQTSALRGKTIIVNFWATWCVPCRAEMPLLQSYYDKHKAEGLEVVAISMDDAKDVAAVRKMAQTFTFPVALKGEADFKGLGRIWRMPSTFVIDKNGILRKNGHVGDAELTQTELEAVVTPLLAQ